MPFSQGDYNAEQLAIVQATFDRICAELRICKNETKRRECVAGAVMSLAHVGQYDPDKVKIYAISRLQKLDSEGQQ